MAKAFGAVQALRGVSFTIAAGDAHACVGENGAGKSTLLKILAGILKPDRGELSWAGERIHFSSPREALERGIGMVYQEMLAFPNLSVTANIFAGREITNRWGMLDERAMRARTQELLTQLHVPVTPDMSMERVSTACSQLVQVARALAFDCRVLVLDEPTTSLTDAEVDHLFGVVGRLRQQGVTVLFVSHRLPEVYRLCDRITVLRDGQFVGTFERATTPSDDIVRAMVGREPPARVPRAHSSSVPQFPSSSVPQFPSSSVPQFPSSPLTLAALRPDNSHSGAYVIANFYLPYDQKSSRHLGVKPEGRRRQNDDLHQSGRLARHGRQARVAH